jgi:hypothetical protein
LWRDSESERLRIGVTNHMIWDDPDSPASPSAGHLASRPGPGICDSPPQGLGVDAKLPRHRPKGQPTSQEPPGPSSVDVVLPGPAEPPAVRPGSVESRTDPLPDQLALELRDGR